MMKVSWVGLYLRHPLFKGLKIPLCAAALCAAGTAARPATASTLNTIYTDTTDTYGYLTLGYPVAVAGGRVIGNYPLPFFRAQILRNYFQILGRGFCGFRPGCRGLSGMGLRP